MSKQPKTKAAEYRQRAQTSREVARWTSLRESREHLLEAAKHLDALADEEERRDAAPKPRAHEE
ncbi:hypothetical protein [Microvirga sp. P5_D2]